MARSLIGHHHDRPRHDDEPEEGEDDAIGSHDIHARTPDTGRGGAQSASFPLLRVA